MAAISGFLTAYLKIQDGGQTIELREHRVYMNLKSYALETFVLRDQFEFLYILLLLTLYICNVVAAILKLKMADRPITI